MDQQPNFNQDAFNIFAFYYNFYANGMHQYMQFPQPIQKKLNAKPIVFHNFTENEVKKSIDMKVVKNGNILTTHACELLKQAENVEDVTPQTSEDKAVANYAMKMLIVELKKRLEDRLQQDVKKHGTNYIVGVSELKYFDHYFSKKWGGTRSIRIMKKGDDYNVWVCYKFDNEFQKTIWVSEFEGPLKKPDC